MNGWNIRYLYKYRNERGILQIIGKETLLRGKYEEYSSKQQPRLLYHFNRKNPVSKTKRFKLNNFKNRTFIKTDSSMQNNA